MKLPIWKKRDKSGPITTEDTSLGTLLEGREYGSTVKYGPLEMIPLTGSNCPENIFTAPGSSLVLPDKPQNGKIRIKNLASQTALIPLHLGLLSPDHYLCSARILEKNQTAEFTDAATLPLSQSAISGPGEGSFSFLPHALRASAFQLMGVTGHTKLWGKFEKLAALIGPEKLNEGYKETLSAITQKLKPQPGQTGAIFLVYGNVVGIELAPDVSFWENIHPILIKQGYGPLTLIYRDTQWEDLVFRKLDIDNIRPVGDMKAEFEAQIKAREEKMIRRIQELSPITFNWKEIQEEGIDTLFSVTSDHFWGQVVFHGAQPAWLSLFHPRISQL
ncbi:MAG: hypothetical protein SF052_26405 [Bacteroidia bacterium]|nr:hypothetical protein [Bacteroidia bacterium]